MQTTPRSGPSTTAALARYLRWYCVLCTGFAVCCALCAMCAVQSLNCVSCDEHCVVVSVWLLSMH